MYRGTLGGIIPEKGVKSRNGFSGRVTGGGSAGSSPRTSFVLKSDAARDLVAAVEKNQGFTVARFQSAGSLKL
jgi:ATP-dependent phosphoenolpyruvate carboxykinase